MDEQEYFNTKLATPMLDSVLDKIVERSDETLKEKLELEQSLEKALFVMGNRNAGKTSMIIDAFSLIDEEVRPTLALDFYCALHSTEDNFHPKECSIWELGGGTSYTSILMSFKMPKNLGLVIMLDLSSPNTLWHTIITFLDIFRQYINEKENLINVQNVPDSHKDKHLIKPFPVPLFIVGGKYDLFQEFEPEKKRAICQSLRYLAHFNYAFLFFYSNKKNLNTSIKTARNIFYNYAFDTSLTIQEQFDYNHPIVIPPGADTFDAIEGSEFIDVETGLEKYNKLLNSYFKQDEQETKLYPENPRYNANYKEPKIDYIRSQKDEVLENLIQETEAELKLKQSDNDFSSRAFAL